MKFDKPVEIDEITAVFASNIVGTLIPKRDDLPEEFRKSWHSNEWCTVASLWFAQGAKKSDFHPKEDIDLDKALRHVKVVLGSFEPSHEHKIGAAGYLMKQFFKKIEYTRHDGTTGEVCNEES